MCVLEAMKPWSNGFILQLLHRYPIWSQQCYDEAKIDGIYWCRLVDTLYFFSNCMIAGVLVSTVSLEKHSLSRLLDDLFKQSALSTCLSFLSNTHKFLFPLANYIRFQMYQTATRSHNLTATAILSAVDDELPNVETRNQTNGSFGS